MQSLKELTASRLRGRGGNLHWPPKYKMKQIPKMDILYFRYSRKKQKNNGVGDISSLFQKHCQNNQSPPP